MNTLHTLNLDTLMAGLTKSAGLDEQSAPNVDASIAISDILEKKASEDIASSAFAAGEQLAKELLTKLAADNVIQEGTAAIVAADDHKIVPNETGGTIDAPLQGTVEEAVARGAKSDDIVDPILDGTHTKEAQTKLENTEMARSIMQKIAQIVGEEVTTPAAGENLEGGSVPNVIQAGNAEMTAQDDAKVQPLPGAEGSLNSILEAVVARAEDQGAVSDDLVNGDKPASSAEGQSDEQEKAAAVDALVQAGCDFDSAVAMVKEAEEMLNIEADQQEKIAAIDELCSAGYDFDSAVALVKKAEAELSGEYEEQEKVAAVGELMGEGYSFEDAVALVKEATARTLPQQARVKIERTKRNVAEGYGAAKTALKSEALKASVGLENATTKGHVAKGLKQLGKNRLVQGVAAVGALSAGALALKKKMEKKAAFEALVEAGVDFEQAMDMVKQAEIDVYGEE